MLKGIRWIENIISGLTLVVLTVSVFLGVIFRYVLNNPLVWSEEMALVCFIWMTFVGSSIVLREKGHIQLDLTKLIKVDRLRNGLEWLGHLAVILILVVFIYYGFKQVAFATDKTTALQLPWKYVFLAVPVGSILMLIRMLEKLSKLIFTKKEAKESDSSWSL
nr:TRAP transporter small permease [Ammoniphilus resinae]